MPGVREKLSLLLVLATPLVAGDVRASDGRIELNDTVATVGGVTPGDAPGFPVTLSVSGSYLLTGDLTPPANTGGLEVTAPYVSVDLNGFSIRSTFLCASGNCPPAAGDPYGVFASADGFALSNGTVRGFGVDCVFTLGVARIERVHARDCAQNGIFVDGRSLVLDSRVERVATDGIDFRTPDNGLARGNDVSDVALRVASSESIRGGTETGGNRCAAGDCSSRGVRRFYLTDTVPPANVAPGACIRGFHMASAFELLDPTGLEYADDLGADAGDSGSGAPAALEGRVRTGQIASTTANCLAYASVDGGHMGTHLVLEAPAAWNAPGVQHSPWRAETVRPCNVPARVWCIED